IKYINFAIAIALVVLLGCVYWFAWRPLSGTSGSVAAPVSAPATITRDALGVPHISAASELDALFLQGFATAQDRLWQMDVVRRLAAGELAEVIGPGALPSDQEARRLRMRRVAESHYRSMSPGDRAILSAYARGVNFFIESHRGRLPLEFSLLGYEPRPWSVVDSVLVSLQLGSILSKTWLTELQKEDMLKGGDTAKVAALFPVRAGFEFSPGSNAWAVSGARTASGRALLAGDPHLEFSLPSVWYMVHLRAPGLNVTGVTLAGLPGVIIGHNERIAWSITNLHFDVQDFYIEKLDPVTGRYQFKGMTEQARPEREIIAVKGGKPVQLVTWVTRHGPVFIAEGGRFLALRWLLAEPGGFTYPILDINRSRNWSEFRAALVRFLGPGSNFIYADADGHIGYQAAGKFPIRTDYDGDVPVDGSSGKFEWQGLVPFEQLPTAFNPPSGTIISANQNPFPEGFPFRIGGGFSSPYRADQIRARLSSRKGWRSEDMLRLQTDVYSAFHRFLASQIVTAYDRQRAKVSSMGASISLVRSWDGQMRKGSAAAMIVELSSEHLRRAIANRASPGKGLIYTSQMAPAVIERLLRDRPKDWFADWDQVLLQNLTDAVEEGQRLQGPDVTRWDYGRYNQLGLVNPIIGRLPFAGKYFNIGPEPMSGAGTTVQQVRLSPRVGPSMRMIVDFSDLDRSLQNLTLGESGQVLSRHYKDQWSVYMKGRSFPMQFRNIEAKEVLTFNPTRE
ncbi:MAG: penicillin acylase family protein, partial [Bryobacteraceae bacterium]